MSNQLERGMEGMPRNVRSMKKPTIFKALRESRDVSARDTSVNRLGKVQQNPTGGKKNSNHPHKPNNLVNKYPDVTEHQKRIVSFQDPTSEIMVGNTFMGGRQKYLQSRKNRV